MASASRFAHLNRTPKASDDDGSDDTEDTDTNADGEGEGDDDTDPKDKKSKKNRRSDDGGDDTDEGDDEADAADEKDDTTAQARARERGRCAAIFMSAGARANPAAAAEIAFGTRMSRSEAVRVLSTMAGVRPQQVAAPQRPGATLRERMGAEGGAPLAPDRSEGSTERAGARLLSALPNRRHKES